MARANPTTTPDFGELTPSARLVYLVLEREAPLTQGELADRTELATRTVQNALRQLTAADVVDEEVCLRDARKRIYSLHD